jgi:predicted nucleic acid-binding protein
MLLLDTSFLVALEEEFSQRQQGPARALLGAHRREAGAISVVALGEFAEGFEDLQDFNTFVSRFQVVQLSRSIAWRTAQLQTSLTQRLGENDAWIAATALAYDATLVGRDACFARVPRLRYLEF